MIERIALVVIVGSFAGIVVTICYGLWEWLTFKPRMVKAKKEADEWYENATKENAGDGS